MCFRPGDHICAIYSTRTELAEVVARFLAEGLRLGQRCWYVASGDETDAIRAALRSLNVDVRPEIAHDALKLISADGAYVVRGHFDPEATLTIFNDAIEQAYADGFSGFRAAAEMSWALEHQDGAHQLIVYEALLRSLFANCRAIGLCLYDRHRMPLPVINGALATHPIAGSNGQFRGNAFYDSTIDRLSGVADSEVLEKLEQIDRRDDSHPKRL